MKTRKPIVPWVIAIFLLSMSLGSLPHFSSLLFFLAAVALVPIKKVQDSISNLIPKKWVRIVCIILLIVIAFISFPLDTTSPENDTPSSPDEIESIETPSHNDSKDSGKNSKDESDTKLESDSKPNSNPETDSETDLETDAETDNETGNETNVDVDAESKPEPEPQNSKYVLNTSTKRYHIPSCYQINKIKDENYAEYLGTEEELIDKGYVACKTCH